MSVEEYLGTARMVIMAKNGSLFCVVDLMWGKCEPKLHIYRSAGYVVSLFVNFKCIRIYRY